MGQICFVRTVGRAAGAVIAIVSALAGGCAIDVEVGQDNTPKPITCDTNADCGAFGPGAVCGAGKTCIAAGSCSVNNDCLSKELNHICRKSDHTCVPVTSPECPTVQGDLTRDDALMFGSILPLSSTYESFGKPVEFAIRLAISTLDIGIPTKQSGNSRPIVYISCDDMSDFDGSTAVNAAKHLSEVVQVPAIIGEAFSGYTLEIATQVTISNGTLLISPAATADEITTLADNGLVWRTSPPDALQADALKLYIPNVENEVRQAVVASGGVQDAPVKIAIIHNDDSYGINLADALVTDTSVPLTINGDAVTDASNKNYFIRQQYSSGDTASQQAVINKVAQVFHPHIIVVLGFSEAISIMSMIENDWTGGPLRPRYVFADGVMSTELADAVGSNDDLRRRITGTIPGTDNAVFKKFVAKYSLMYPGASTAYPATTFGAAGGYDSVFLLAYSAVALNGKPESGANLAQGFGSLSPSGVAAATKIDVGDGDFAAGAKLLLQNKVIDVNGASGPLDFDLIVGEAKSDIQIWCIPLQGAGAGPAITSGLYYNGAGGMLSGAIGSQCDFTP